MSLISLSFWELFHLLILVITSPWLFLFLPWLLLLTTIFKWLCPHGPAPLLFWAQTLSEHPLQPPQFAVDYPTASHKSQMNNPWTFTSTYPKLNSLSIFPLSSLPTPIPPHTYTSFPIILMISTFIHTAVQARKQNHPDSSLFFYSLIFYSSHPNPNPSHSTTVKSSSLILFRHIFFSPFPPSVSWLQLSYLSPRQQQLTYNWWSFLHSGSIMPPLEQIA